MQPETKHTPGPWAYMEGDAARFESSRISRADDREFTIALVNCEWLNKSQREQDIANARLIAAAPDLLEALKHHQWAGYGGYTCPACDQTKRDDHRPNCEIAAAIAKAKGGADGA